jgi:UDP-N-acetylmuramate dehydrogenase
VSAELRQTLQNSLGERARFEQPMSAHTTWGVGGPAWCVCHVTSAEEAGFVIRSVLEAGMPWMPLGRGSNLLVRDKGYPGVMLRLAGPLASLRREGDGLWAGGGAHLPAAVKFAARLGLAGLEWAAGIPGTVGGAVATNAGALGADMAGLTSRITLLMADGQVQTLPGDEIPAEYRRRLLPVQSLVLAALLDLAQESADAVTLRGEESLARRRQTQPGGQPCAGSVFKNPPGDFAGRLIEEAGCKGLSMGGAQVSPKHANFIINRGRATARDVLSLMDVVREKVRQASGIELEPEVEVVGSV